MKIGYPMWLKEINVHKMENSAYDYYECHNNGYQKWSKQDGIIEIETFLLILWHQRPTNLGSRLVHALGSIVSNEFVNPCMIERPVTEAVIEPSVMPARASVEIWPIEITEATIKEYSNSWVLASEN